MKIKALMFGCAILFAVTAQARLGETKQELLTRYGKPSGQKTTSKATVLFFERPGMQIMVVLRQESDRAVAIQYRTKNPLSKLRLSELLERNREARNWSEEEPAEKELSRWTRSDGGRATYYSRVVIGDDQYIFALVSGRLGDILKHGTKHDETQEMREIEGL